MLCYEIFEIVIDDIEHTMIISFAYKWIVRTDGHIAQFPERGVLG